MQKAVGRRQRAVSSQQLLVTLYSLLEFRAEKVEHDAVYHAAFHKAFFEIFDAAKLVERVFGRLIPHAAEWHIKSLSL